MADRVMAREYRIALPKEKKLEALIEKARKKIEGRTSVVTPKFINHLRPSFTFLPRWNISP